MRKYVVRYQTKSWYEVEVLADNPENAVKLVKNAKDADLINLTINSHLEDEDLTPADVQTPYADTKR